MDSWRDYLSAPVEAASLAVFRICLGLAVSASFLEYLWPGNNTLETAFVTPGWNFPYPGFEWVTPLSPALLKACFFLTALAGVFFAAGVFYRFSAIIVFLGYSYYFLLDAARFNNHYYLISLLTFLFLWLPADRRFVLRLPSFKSSVKPPVIHRWPVFLLQAQLFIVYFYGGLAKLNGDWITGEPILGSAEIFKGMLDSAFPLLEAVESIVYARIMAWTGLVFDFMIGFLLLIPRSRLLALALLAIFHGINQLTLPIGVFPFLAFTASFIFLEPDWPLRLGAWLRKPSFARPDRRWLIGGAILVPGVGTLLGWRLPGAGKVSGKSLPSSLSGPAFAFVFAWLTWQSLLPLRHYFIAGDPNWTEEGQEFAWRMMLRQKAAGSLTIHLDDPSIYDRESRGRRIDWTRLPDSESRAVYVPIDATGFVWKENQGLNTFYEGLASFRLIQVVQASSKPELTAERSALESWWKEQTGELPRIRETRSLAACLEAASDRLQEVVKGDSAVQVESLGRLLEGARNQLRVMDEVDPNQRERYLTGIHDCLYTVLDSEYGDLLRDELILAHPFSLLGIEPPSGQRFWVIAQCESAGEMQTLSESLNRGENTLVWCDFSRLRFYEWGGLPEWLPVFESGRLPILWNYFRELNRHQTEQLAIRPFLIRQYARRIADIWATRYGHRPVVHGYGSVMMNYRYPRPLIDPETDLASVPYRFWSHNVWILPLESDRIGISDRLRKADPKLESKP